MEAIIFREAIPGTGALAVIAALPLTALPAHHTREPFDYLVLLPSNCPSLTTTTGEPMLVLSIDLVPGGDAYRRRTIASMRISNVSNLADISDYEVNIMEGANALAGTKPRNGSCTVEGHDRRQSVWSLVAKAAAAALQAEFDEL
jgi:hypothetical protein